MLMININIILSSIGDRIFIMIYRDNHWLYMSWKFTLKKCLGLKSSFEYLNAG